MVINVLSAESKIKILVSQAFLSRTENSESMSYSNKDLGSNSNISFSAIIPSLLTLDLRESTILITDQMISWNVSMFCLSIFLDLRIVSFKWCLHALLRMLQDSNCLDQLSDLRSAKHIFHSNSKLINGSSSSKVWYLLSYY